MKTRLRLLQASCLTCLIVTVQAQAHTAFAQSASVVEMDSAGSEQSSQASDEGLTDIVVTASKRAENLQNVAIAVTSLSGDAISVRGIKDPIEIQAQLPAVEFKVTTTPSVVIRGVGTYNNQPGVDSAVAYSVDGIYLSHIPALTPILFDVSRVEAVRGPQGTLFGRNSNGGGIGIITNKPVHDFEASAAAGYGNYDAFSTEAMLNIPLGRGVALRASFASDQRDPYYKSGQSDADNYAGRARLLVEPTDNLEIIATVDYASTRNNGQGMTYCPKNSELAECAGRPFDPYLGLEQDTSADYLRIKNFGAYGEINYQTPIGTLTSLTGYRWYKLNNLYTIEDLGYSPNSENRFFTQEVRLSSDSSSNIKWVVGAFYSRETLTALEAYAFFGAPAIESRVTDSVATSKAVFGQVTVPMIEWLRLTGGLRYTDEKKSAFGTATSFGEDGATVVDTGGSSREKRVTWKAGIDFDLSSTSLLYASVSNGFKSGGVNQVPPGAGLVEAYRPETIVAYQIGSKNRFAGNRIQLNAEAFYYDYKGYQTFFQQGLGTNTFFTTINSQKATFYGGEIEASALISPVDRLDVTVALLHAKFDRFVTPAQDFSGNEVQSAPRYTVSASYEHIFELRNGDNIVAQVDTRLVDGNYADNSNIPETYQDTYTRSGATLRYEGKGGWSISAFVRNIEGTGVLQSLIGKVFRGSGFGLYQPPRTYGVMARLKI